MNWMEIWRDVAPFMVLAGTVYIGHRTAKVTVQGTTREAEMVADEKRHETDTTSIVDFNHQLLEERGQLLDRLGRVENQVTNGHKTNLRDDLTEVKDNGARMLQVVEDGMRKLYDEHIPLLHRNIAGLTEDVRGLRTDLTTLERKVVAGEG